MTDYGKLAYEGFKADFSGYEKKDNQTFHPLFGLITANDQGLMNVNEDSLTAQFQDYVGRNIGLNKRLVDNLELAEELDNPITRLKKKNDDIGRLRKDLAEEYRKHLVNFYNRGYTHEDSERMALKIVKSRAEVEMGYIESKYPLSNLENAGKVLGVRNLLGLENKKKN